MTSKNESLPDLPQELRTIAVTVGDTGGWRIAGLKILAAANEIEKLHETRGKSPITQEFIRSLRRMSQERWAIAYEHDSFFEAIAKELEYLSGGALRHPEICPNCDTALPPGCNGRFKSDGAACWLNRSSSSSAEGKP